VVVFTVVATVGITGRAQGGGAARAGAGPAGNAETGKAVWALGNTSCRNCHGDNAEGGFGPALAAGVDLNFERVRAYLRNPAGRMPAYPEAELTDQEIADLVAYWASAPPATKAAAWRAELPANAPRGQALSISVMGCGQCHGATMTTPRHGMAEVNGDFEWFKKMVYTHTSALREQWAMFEPNAPKVTPGPAGPPGRNRVRMGNYTRDRLPEPLLKEIYDWMHDLGPLMPLQVRLTPAQGGGSTYNLTVANGTVKGKGMNAEDVTVSVEVPEGVQVTNTTGTGYEGVKSAEGKNLATFRIPRLGPGETQMFTLTTSAPAPGLRGTASWAKPAVKSDGQVNFQLPGGRGRGAA
jgi:mono/diheme cytochrome c family protein